MSPYYDFQCPKCKKKKTDVLVYTGDKVACECGEEMEKIFAPSLARVSSETRGCFGEGGAKKKLNLKTPKGGKMPRQELKHGQRGGVWKDW